MKLINFLKDKYVYLLINVIVLFIGYLLVHRGMSTEINNKTKTLGGIYISLGTSLIATAIVFFLDLAKHLSINELLRKVNNVINEGGIQWIYTKRDLDKYDKLMKQLSTSLDIAGYSLGAFFDSYSEELGRKLKHKNSGIKVRMLLVDPESTHSTRRAEIEGRNPRQFKDKIETLRDYFKEVAEVEIRFFAGPLSSMIFRIDNTMFVGPHFYKRQSKATLTQELASNHWLFEEYQNEFNRMWEDSSEVV